MATIVASRYAVLSIDDDDEDVSLKKKKISNKKPTTSKPTGKLQNTASSNKSENNVKKKKKQDSVQNQNVKNRGKPNTSSGSAKKKKEPTAAQWEEWKQKDDKFVQGNFEEDLSKAIFLSKLDYEQNKVLYDTVKKKGTDEKKPKPKKNRKGQKVMSLTEFNNLGSQENKKESSTKSRNENCKEPEFFNKLDQDIQSEISKEHFLNRIKEKESITQESLSLILYKALVEKRDEEIVQLKAEIERLNTQLKNVKTRNTKLCQIIANGEMKDKAEALMEVERLQTIKDELAAEVASLHIQLEQERSKVRQLSTDHKSKDKGKKHQHNSSSEA